ncbi:MAG: tetratricopeptide repeat protein, partial [Bacteroidota bacterium]
MKKITCCYLLLFIYLSWGISTEIVAQTVDSARALHKKAFYAGREGKPDSAHYYYQQANAAYESLGLDSLQMDLHLDWTVVYIDLSQFEQADSLLDWVEARVFEYQPRPHKLIQTYYNYRGSLAYRMGDLETALAYDEKTLALRQSTPDVAKRNIAGARINLGLTLSDLGRLDEAFDQTIQGLQILREIGREETSFAGNACTNLSIILNQKGDIEAAIAYAQEAIRIRTAYYGPDHPQVGLAYINLGSLYWEQKKLDEAMLNYQKGLPVVENVLGAEHPYVANTLVNFAQVLGAKGEVETAEEYMVQAVSIHGKVYAANSQPYAMSLTKVADLYVDMGEYGKADTMLAEGIQIYQKLAVKSPERYADAFAIRGEAAFRQKDYHKAIEDAEMAREILNQADKDNNKPMASGVKLKSLFLQARSLIAFGKGSAGMEEVEAGVALYLELLETIRILRRDSNSPEGRNFLAASQVNVVEEILDACHWLQEEKPSDQWTALAFESMERSRALNLLDASQESKAREFAGLPESFLQKEAALRGALESYRQQIQQNVSEEQPDSLRLSFWNSRIFSLQQSLDSLVKVMEQKYPA